MWLTACKTYSASYIRNLAVGRSARLSATLMNGFVMIVQPETKISVRRTSLQYEYRCLATGAVKAYKKMSPQKAGTLNHTLRARGAHGCWVRPPELAETYRWDVRYVDGFVGEDDAAAD